jgi:hypothetical protein
MDPKRLLIALSTAILLHFYNLSQAQPVFEWATILADTINTKATYITTDSAGDVYIAGGFDYMQDFDPGPGKHILRPIFTQTANSRNTGFLLKLDANKNFLHAHATGYYITAMDIDSKGNIHATGYFLDSADFDPGPGVVQRKVPNPGTYEPDIFIAKWDKNYNLQWAHSFGDYDDENGFDIKVDRAGNVHVAGYYNGRVDFNPGPDSAYLQTNWPGSFLLKLDGRLAYTLRVFIQVR